MIKIWTIMWNYIISRLDTCSSGQSLSIIPNKGISNRSGNMTFSFKEYPAFLALIHCSWNNVVHKSLGCGIFNNPCLLLNKILKLSKLCMKFIFKDRACVNVSFSLRDPKILLDTFVALFIVQQVFHQTGIN